MSTTAVSPEVQTPVTQSEHKSENFSFENYTLVVGYPKEELAKPVNERKKKAYPEDHEMVSEESQAKGEFEVAFSQTFRQYSPSNITGINELVPDDDEVVNLVAAQLKVKQVNRARSLVTSKDFVPQDATIDQFDECNKKSERRLTPFEKTKNEILNNMPKELQAQLLALLQAQVGTGAQQ